MQVGNWRTHTGRYFPMNKTNKQKRKKNKEGDIVYVNLIENFYKRLFYFYF